MFGSVRRNPERKRLAERVAAWTRERFELPPGAAVSVSEIACGVPGCPPRETVVLFWIGEQGYQFKLFKPMAEVTAVDLPYQWLRETLAVEEGVGPECC
jgi:hypothetical protein